MTHTYIRLVLHFAPLSNGLSHIVQKHPRCGQVEKNRKKKASLQYCAVPRQQVLIERFGPEQSDQRPIIDRYKSFGSLQSRIQ